MVVADSGPLIAFARIDRLDLLHRIVGSIIIPDAVYMEVVTRGRGKPGSAEIAQTPWIQRRSIEDPTELANLPPTLHAGEREAIVLAQGLGAQLLIDEKRGRDVAMSRGLDIVGTLGVLAQANRRGFVDHPGAVLRALAISGYWIDADLVIAFLTQVGDTEDTGP